MNNILLIANPASGKFNYKKILKIKEIIENKSYNVTIALTGYRGHGEILATQSDADTIIAAGGDGIINEVARGVAGTDKLFYALPLGTVNVFCKEYGISRNPIKAAKQFTYNHIKKIPAGYIDNKIFLLMAGFGFDATIVRTVETKGVKFKPLKTLVHVIYGFPAFFSEKYDHLFLYYNGKRMGFYHGVFAVAASYAGTYKLGKIKLNMINAFIVHHRGRLALLKAFTPLFFWRGFSGTHISSDMFKIDGVKFCQLDGEYTKLDNRSTYISVKKDAINFLSPKE